MPNRPTVVRTCIAAALALTFTACQETPDEPGPIAAPQLSVSGDPVDQSPIFADFSAINEELQRLGSRKRGKKKGGSSLDVALGVVEYVTVDNAGEYGRIVIASDRGNKQLIFDWVPGDPRRGGRTDITYMVDQSDGAANGGALPNSATEPAIDRAMSTWDAVQCSESVPSDLRITKLPFNGVDLGVVQALLGFGGTISVFADVSHAGWLPKAFFSSPPFFPPNGGEFILGATFTAGFIDGSGNFTDIDGNGKLDTAFREIYYNDNPAFGWGIDVGTFPFDVETVALHESGHGLSQAHFGDIFIDGGSVFLHFAPFAVMNAAISRQAQALEGTDEAGHCSIWANWPNN